LPRPTRGDQPGGGRRGRLLLGGDPFEADARPVRQREPVAVPAPVQGSSLLHRPEQNGASMMGTDGATTRCILPDGTDRSQPPHISEIT
jgi:hypothetical protein